MKKIIYIFILTTSLFLFNQINLFAETDYVYLGGDSIGLKLNTGVVVTGKYQVETRDGKIKPWIDSDIVVGDKILMYNDFNIESTNNLIRCLRMDDNDTATIKILRDKQEIYTNINIARTMNNEKSLGLYINDSVLGVGTLTYIDPDDYSYVALGHGINNEYLTEDIKGNLYECNIISIDKGKVGKPGEKKATFEPSTIGDIQFNNKTGIYGLLNNRKNLVNRKKVSLSKINEVKLGKANIYTVINGNIVKPFEIEIIDINNQEEEDIKGLKFRVTDKELISKSGGIVQGMSGSPIVQNNKIIGAVSHVTIDNPLIGYGIHICWMENNDINIKIE